MNMAVIPLLASVVSLIFALQFLTSSLPGENPYQLAWVNRAQWFIKPEGKQERK